MKKVLSFVLITSVMLLAYSCNCGSKEKKCEKTESCCKEGHKAEVKKIVITAYLDIKIDQVEKFLAEVQEVITKSKAEEGNASYNLFADLKEKNKFVFVEEWKGQAAVDTHFATEHFKKFGALMDEVAAAPPKIKIFEVINEK
ncbi:MAG: antibiotic biosynthesis monooxygenase [Prevotellaceae bacterium]|jgi:quinol monooxygenase YgiN|nr:antibiotic biosynthesis monooxygenase [Prevotellaceae bacterium]